MGLFSFLTNSLSTEKDTAVPLKDKTVYHIETTTKTYEGIIMHQTDTMIKLMNTNYKSVTILKANIKQIKVALKVQG